MSLDLSSSLPWSRARAGLGAVAIVLSAVSAVGPVHAAWEPTRPVEFVVPAGTGGGADQMARFIQGVVTRHSLMKQPLVVVNKSGGAGAEGFLQIKDARRDPHKLVITLSNLFTTPLGTGVPVNWKDMTPVAMLALDQFVLWVNADSPHKSAGDYLEAVRSAPDHTFKMAGTGSKQEDQIITVALQKAAGRKLIYVPFKGGGDVAVQLVGNHVDSTVNNPIEAVAHWRSGKLRPLCVFDDERMPYKAKITDTLSWNDIPSCTESGIPVDYLMMRGIFMPPGVTAEQVAWYVELFRKVRATPEWQEFMEKGAFKDSFMTGNAYIDWVAKAEELHRALMRDAGFIAK